MTARTQLLLGVTIWLAGIASGWLARSILLMADYTP